MDLLKGWESDLTKLPETKKSGTLGKRGRYQVIAPPRDWKYAYTKGLGGQIYAQRWAESPEMKSANINRFDIKQVSLPESYNPDASQFPWQQTRQPDSDFSRQAAYATGITPTQTTTSPDFYGKYNPAWSFDMFGYNPYEGFMGTRTKQTTRQRNTPRFQVPNINVPTGQNWYQYQKRTRQAKGY